MLSWLFAIQELMAFIRSQASQRLNNDVLIYNFPGTVAPCCLETLKLNWSMLFLIMNFEVYYLDRQSHIHVYPSRLRGSEPEQCILTTQFHETII